MNILLLILSCLILAYLDVTSFGYLAFCIIISFNVCKYLSKRKKKFILVSTIALFSLVLFYMRIQGLINSNVVNLLGISYYSLTIISYLVDTYKNKFEVPNFLIYTLSIIYIPQLFIGPIASNKLISQLKEKRKFKFSNIYEGTWRILWGLFKKLIIAGRCSILISTIVTNSSSGFYAFSAMLLYSLNLYADFSGGIDIVLGCSKIFDLNLTENFNLPFLAENIKEFWHRWHISLSTWLRNYIYIPLGGNKCSKIRRNFNVLITFMISGLWHGINYLLWGFIHGILVICSKYYISKNKYFNIILNFILVSILWSFFIWDNNIVAIKMIISIFTNFNIINFLKNFFNLGLSIADWCVLLGSSILLVLFEIKQSKICQCLNKISLEKKIILIFSFVLIILVFGIYGIGFDVNEFIYSKF